MTIGIETCLVVALAFAVFAAVTALGSSLVLGIGFERLRAGFEIVKSQTGFFSESIHKLDKRVSTVEKQGQYVFQTLHTLEQEQASLAQRLEKGPVEHAEEPELPAALIRISKSDSAPARSLGQLMWDGNPEDEIRFN